MNSTNSLGSTSITVQFTLDRKIDAAAQDIQAAISRAGGRLPPSMPRPPSYQKVNPAEQPVFYLALDSDHAAHVHRQRVRRHPAGAAHLHGQRRFARAGLRRAEIRRARAGGPRQAGRARHRHRRSAARHRLQQHQPAHRPAGWRQAGLHHSIQRLAGQRRRLTGRSSWPGATGPPSAWNNSATCIDSVENDKVVAWYNNKRGRDPGHPAPARHQHRGGGGQRQRTCCRSSARRFRPPCTSPSPSMRRNPSAAPFATSSSRCCSPSAWWCW